MDIKWMPAYIFMSMGTAKHEEAAIYAVNTRIPNVYIDFGSASGT